MGILDCFKLCSPLIETAASTTYEVHRQKRTTCNIYIDGLSVWFLGYTNGAPNIANAHQKLIDILHHIRSGDYFTINSITIYFNGEYPALRGKPISQRVNSWEVRKWCSELLDDGTINNVKFLDVGEAESECFFERDKRFASMIVTKDSDIVPICYKYNRRTSNDTVFCYLTHREIFYDTNFLTTKLNKCAFTLLVSLRSNDFIEPIFSFTMVKIIFDLLLNNISLYNNHFKLINSIIRETNEDNIKKCIVYFIWIMVDAKQRSLGNFKWPPIRTEMETENYLEVLDWSIMYSKFGKNINNYNENFRMACNNMSKFYFILSLCKSVFPIFREYAVNNFQDIENIMGDIEL
ncbi:GSCOCT00014056001.2-RA-CDS [Cotesia congregata]|uniref:Cc_fen1_1a n=1 Tax=Cotesia congregata TaxID=51543 RepID=A0A8J2HG00_COTCN|nr:GSCOCT00014056001.2-RA-CDS [Cotesia congregata]CAG5095882.1 Cc_fen1_1a [Cotesia congregata]